MPKSLWHLSSISNHSRSMHSRQLRFNINKMRNNNILKLTSSHRTLSLWAFCNSNTRPSLISSHQRHFSNNNVIIHHPPPPSPVRVHSTRNRLSRH
jgi:hypothetical protein